MLRPHGAHLAGLRRAVQPHGEGDDAELYSQHGGLWKAPIAVQTMDAQAHEAPRGAGAHHEGGLETDEVPERITKLLHLKAGMCSDHVAKTCCLWRHVVTQILSHISKMHSLLLDEVPLHVVQGLGGNARINAQLLEANQIEGSSSGFVEARGGSYLSYYGFVEAHSAHDNLVRGHIAGTTQIEKVVCLHSDCDSYTAFVLTQSEFTSLAMRVQPQQRGSASSGSADRAAS